MHELQRHRPIAITFIITGLGTGGAEMMLLKLLSRLDRKRFDPAVISLQGTGAFAAKFSALEIPLFTLDIPSGRLSLGGIIHLTKLLRRLRPDVIQGWMYHGNLAAHFAKFLSLRATPVVWNIRGTVVELERESFTTAATIWLGARLSGCAARVINNSDESARLHCERLGYSRGNVSVIPNGFLVDEFRPDGAARRDFRRFIGAGDGDLLVGSIGRLHPMKDHESFLRAAALVSCTFSSARFVLVGADVDNRSQALKQLADRLGIGSRVTFVGPRDDIAKILPGFDLMVLASAYGEGFPNAVGEAMSCGVPCVVTDVGDSRRVVGDTGEVVPPQDAGAIADACLRIMAMPAEVRAALGERARRRIVDHFSLEAVVQQYQDIYENIGRHSGPSGAV